MLSEWQQVKGAVAGLPAWMRSRVRYWIADQPAGRGLQRHPVVTATPDLPAQ